MKKFLIVVDTQFDFVMPSGALYVQGAEDIIVPGIELLASLDPNEYTGVLFTHDTHHRDTYFDLPESKQFPIHCVLDEFGWENVFNNELINNAIPVFALEKGVFSMWEEDGLKLDNLTHPAQVDDLDREVFFKRLKSLDTTIEVMGVASDYCVKWAVDGLVERGFNVEVLGHLCRGIAQPTDEVFDLYPTVKVL